MVLHQNKLIFSTSKWSYLGGFIFIFLQGYIIYKIKIKHIFGGIRQFGNSEVGPLIAVR